MKIILRCFNCGIWQVCEVRDIHKYIFKCRVCGKTRKLKKKREYGLSLNYIIPPPNSKIDEVVRRLNSKRIQ